MLILTADANPGTAGWTDSTVIAGGISGSTTLSGATIGFGANTQNVTVTGAAVGDVVSIGIAPALYNADLIYYGYISAANTLTLVVRELSANVHAYNGVVSYLITRP